MRTTGTSARIDLASRALRPIRRWSWANGRTCAVLAGEDLAVDDGPVGQGVADGGQLGVALGDQLLAARPEEGLARRGG